MINLEQEVVDKIEQDLYDRGELPEFWDVVGTERKEYWKQLIFDAMSDYAASMKKTNNAPIRRHRERKAH